MSMHSDRPPVRVVIIGAGGQGKVVADILHAGQQQTGQHAIAFVDDTPDRAGDTLLGLPVIGPTAMLPEIEHEAIVVAIGDNAVRDRVSRELEARGERIVTVRHPFSSLALGVQIGVGSMLSAGAVITPLARLGRGVLINTNASVDHDSVVEDFAHVSARAVVGAGVHIGARTLIGVGASVMTGRRVGRDAVIGAGALVQRDVPDGAVVVGVPARPLRRPV